MPEAWRDVICKRGDQRLFPSAIYQNESSTFLVPMNTRWPVAFRNPMNMRKMWKCPPKMESEATKLKVMESPSSTGDIDHPIRLRRHNQENASSRNLFDKTNRRCLKPQNVQVRLWLVQCVDLFAMLLQIGLSMLPLDIDPLFARKLFWWDIWIARSDNSADVEILKHTLTESMEGLGSHQLGTPIAADVFTTSGGSWKFVGRTSSTRSQKSSTCTTSACATSPSRHNTPARPGRRPASFGSTSAGLGVLELRTCHLAKLELCKLGGKDRNVIVWSTQQEEDVECSVSLRDNDSGVLDREFDIDFAAAQEESAKQTKKIELYACSC